jgi:hypothetical protein
MHHYPPSVHHDDLHGVTRRCLDAPQLREPVLLGGYGHSTEQERPGDAGTAMIGFIRELD